MTTTLDARRLIAWRPSYSGPGGGPVQVRWRGQWRGIRHAPNYSGHGPSSLQLGVW
jgi:hypothetical protein